MKLLLCSIWDGAVKAYNHPLTFRTKEEAIRAFAESCKNPENNFFRFAKDYTLFAVGTFDEDKGSLDNFNTPQALITALECVPLGEDVFPPGKRLS